MSKYTREDVIRIVRDEHIQFIRLQFVDIFGQLKNVTIPSSQIEKAVDGQIMFDGSSIEGYTRIEESDQYLHPDLDTFIVLPWNQEYGVCARMICDVCNPDVTAFSGDPRGVLRRVLREAADMGYTFNVGPECEFFLFRTDAAGKPTTKTNDEVGYFDQGPLDTGALTRQKICLALEKIGFEIEASHHENAAGQHEIDFKYADALSAADNIMTFKLAVKTLAQGKLNVEVLDGVAISASLLTGDDSTAGSVRFLLGLGDTLDAWTHKKSVDDLAKSMSLQVEQVWLRTEDGSKILVPLEQVNTG
ncbi:MAG: glutamine synthetase beta-grasp domain-containing protein, partial [Oscillospiraceae bacterium]|nr:glutamine synthetase beta-grasp domain-containing protein [Oscillospiraceae bacterium]